MPRSASSAKAPRAASPRSKNGENGKTGKGNGAARAAAKPANGAGNGAPRPSHDDIARRAYEIYEAEGRQPGRDMEYWLRAEADLAAGE